MEPHRWWKTSFAALLLLVLWAAGVTGVPLEDEPAAAVSQLDTPSVEETNAADGEVKLSDREIRELDLIRRQVGKNLVENPLWNDAPAADGSENEFIGELHRRHGISSRPLHIESAAPRTDDDSASPTGSNIQAVIFRQRSLRSLGRRLDAIAQDMDDLRLFDQADELRDMSRRLRAEIRLPASSSSANDDGE